MRRDAACRRRYRPRRDRAMPTDTRRECCAQATRRSPTETLELPYPAEDVRRRSARRSASTLPPHRTAGHPPTLVAPAPPLLPAQKPVQSEAFEVSSRNLPHNHGQLKTIQSLVSLLHTLLC